MHQYKTVTQTLLVLSILNLVFAAPVVPREARDTGNDVVVVANDVTTVSEAAGHNGWDNTFAKFISLVGRTISTWFVALG
jgi:hypothetical protein